MGVRVGHGAVFAANTPRVVLGTPYLLSSGYDVSPDGQRFLVVKPIAAAPITHLNLVLNWAVEVRQKLGLR